MCEPFGVYRWTDLDLWEHAGCLLAERASCPVDRSDSGPVLAHLPNTLFSPKLRKIQIKSTDSMILAVCTGTIARENLLRDMHFYLVSSVFVWMRNIVFTRQGWRHLVFHFKRQRLRAKKVLVALQLPGLFLGSLGLQSVEKLLIYSKIVKLLKIILFLMVHV